MTKVFIAIGNLVLFALIFALGLTAGHFYSELKVADKKIEVLEFQARNSVDKQTFNVLQSKLIKCESTIQSLAEETDYIQTVCDCAWQQDSLFDHFLVWSAYDRLEE